MARSLPQYFVPMTLALLARDADAESIPPTWPCVGFSNSDFLRAGEAHLHSHITRTGVLWWRVSVLKRTAVVNLRFRLKVVCGFSAVEAVLRVSLDDAWTVERSTSAQPSRNPCLIATASGPGDLISSDFSLFCLLGSVPSCTGVV